MVKTSICFGGESLCLSTSATGQEAKIITWVTALALISLVLVIAWLIYKEAIGSRHLPYEQS